MNNKFYWVFPEAEAVGVCDSEEELIREIEQNPLISEVTAEEYSELINLGYEH